MVWATSVAHYRKKTLRVRVLIGLFNQQFYLWPPIYGRVIHPQVLPYLFSTSGLWLSDLTVTQLLLETPAEHERGIINGVQSSLNKLMDILKFLLVMFLPWPEVFGWLIIVSFLFICMGFFMFAIYSHKERGHLFHFEQYGAVKEEAPETRFSEPVIKS